MSERRKAENGERLDFVTLRITWFQILAGPEDFPIKF